MVAQTAVARTRSSPGTPRHLNHSPRGLLRVTVFISGRTLSVLAGIVACAAPALVAAAPVLRCQLDQAGERRTVTFSPTENPYTVIPIEINGRFRFNAVVMGDERRIGYVALYTYYVTGKHAVLLHEAKYLSPVAYESVTPASLTGQVSLYAPPLGREFQYACSLVDQPA